MLRLNTKANAVKIEQVWSEYRNSLKSFLHSKVSDADEVDDLLQEVLIKSHNKLSSIDDESSVKSWLFQVANNTIIDFYRKRARTRNVDADDLWYTSEDMSIQEDLSRCVEPFIRALPEDEDELLVFALRATAIHAERRWSVGAPTNSFDLVEALRPHVREQQHIPN